MSVLSVTHAALRGFSTDLNDIGDFFGANSSRITSAVSLPSGASGLLATLEPSFRDFRNQVSALGRLDHGRMIDFGTHLGGANDDFRNQDVTSGQIVSAAAHIPAGGESGDSTGSIRYSGLLFPVLPEVATGTLTTRNAVTGAHGIVSVFDDRLNGSIGIKPAAHYLAPLADDWEHIQAIGKRIRQLGVNHASTAGNLSGGSNWLTAQWTGGSADSYTTAMTAFHTDIHQRGTELETIGKTLEKGGECLERHVHNQAAGVTSGLMRPLDILGLSLPVGVWGQIVDRPMRGSIKAQITSAVDTVRSEADARSASITDLVDRMHKALAYEPGTAIAEPTGALFDPPGKVTLDYDTIRYGFRNNVWWEQNLAAAA